MTLKLHPNIVRKPEVWAFLLPGTILVFLFWLVNSPFFAGGNIAPLSLGVTADAALLVPLIYFLLIRKSSIPKITVVPVFVLSTFFVSSILPPEEQQFVNLLHTWLVPVAELGVFGFIVYKIRKVSLDFRNKEGAVYADFYDKLNIAAGESFPKLAAHALSAEISMVYYGLLNWKTPDFKENEFTYHRETGIIGLLGAVIFLVVVETSAVHLMLMNSSPVIAWVLSILSIYSGLQIFGMARALPKRPVVLTEKALVLRYGIMADALISYENIESIEITEQDFEFDKETRRLSPLDFDSYNMLLTLKGTQEYAGLWGMRKTCERLAIHIDEPERFAESLRDKIA